jgi:hypothetical protein
MHETIPVTIFVAQGQWEASVIKSRLESEGIPVVLQYESLGIVCGLTVNGLGQVKVMVPQPLEAQARAILEEAQAESEEEDDQAS